MVVFGVDTHKRSHTMVAVDEAGAEVGQLTVPATPEGHVRAVRWAAGWAQRRWAIEDCRHLSRRLEADLITAGEAVVRVPPKMMAGVRRSARTRGKSDPIDALAVAHAAQREPGLPAARLEGKSRELRLLVEYRETLVRERTGLQNRLRWRLHELQPGYDPPAGSLDRDHVLDEIERLIHTHQGVVADLARLEVTRIREITLATRQLERDITTRVARMAPSLLRIPGCGALTAAKLVGEAADITRFHSKNAYAMFTGSAPIPVWSANNRKFRLNRGGNRQTNAALHRIAITQLRIHPPAQQLRQRLLAKGKTKTETLRILKRRLADIAYNAMLTDTPQATRAKAA